MAERKSRFKSSMSDLGRRLVGGFFVVGEFGLYEVVEDGDGSR